MTAVVDGVIPAVLPWFSIDALVDADTHFPTKEEVEVCFNCRYCPECCDYCDGHGNIREVKAVGRPRAEIDMAYLRGMMMLGRTNAEMCAALHISKNTLLKAKKKILEEEQHDYANCS